jgi:hypothetical protein
MAEWRLLLLGQRELTDGQSSWNLLGRDLRLRQSAVQVTGLHTAFSPVAILAIGVIHPGGIFSNFAITGST